MRDFTRPQRRDSLRRGLHRHGDVRLGDAVLRLRLQPNVVWSMGGGGWGWLLRGPRYETPPQRGGGEMKPLIESYPILLTAIFVAFVLSIVFQVAGLLA